MIIQDFMRLIKIKLVFFNNIMDFLQSSHVRDGKHAQAWQNVAKGKKKTNISCFKWKLA